MTIKTINLEPSLSGQMIDPDHGPCPFPALAGQLPAPPHHSVVDTHELQHLLCHMFLTPLEFEAQLDIAIHAGLAIDVQLIETGALPAGSFYAALAAAAGLPLLPQEAAKALWLDPADVERFHRHFGETNVFLTRDGVAICPRGLGPGSIAAYVDALKKALHSLMQAKMGERPITLYLVAPATVQQAIEAKFQAAVLERARFGLFQEAPEQSAKGGPSSLQWLGLFSGLWALIYGYFKAPVASTLALSVFFACFFFLLICMRLAAGLVQSRLALGFRQKPAPFTGSTADLPVYTLLIPLFKEANVLPQLIKALEALDYPKAKLDIKLLLEAVDSETIAAVMALDLPPHYHILIVPEAKPRTKPKALNYGLQFARGDYVVIYDAEDIPEPDQLKQALMVFAQNGPDLATCQAKLNFYNGRDNWLTRQFTVEYCSLFDGLLPAYQLFDFPLPLGGTSNHFRRTALVDAGGWDPFNVTEDADLGMRLYRRGYRAVVFPSLTLEEATSGFYSWLCQRTRWMKGWMQTYYVHMRQPLTLLRELGFWRFLGFQALIGGPTLAALAHPVFLVLLFWHLPYQDVPFHIGLIGLWVLSLFNLSAGYLATMWLGVVTLRLRHLAGFAFSILTIPLYWILISLAVYRALLQLIYAPFLWEKTPHKGKKDNASPSL